MSVVKAHIRNGRRVKSYLRGTKSKGLGTNGRITNFIDNFMKKNPNKIVPSNLMKKVVTNDFKPKGAGMPVGKEAKLKKLIDMYSDGKSIIPGKKMKNLVKRAGYK